MAARRKPWRGPDRLWLAGLAVGADLLATVPRVAAGGGLGAAAFADAGTVGAGRALRLVAGDRRCLPGRCEKGGAQVARSVRGRSGSRFHLAVDANGAPFAIRVGAGNENERAHLLPLIDALLERGLMPRELWADRGYASAALEQALRERAIEPRISKPRRAGEPIAAGTPVREIWRGRRRRP